MGGGRDGSRHGDDVRLAQGMGAGWDGVRDGFTADRGFHWPAVGGSRVGSGGGAEGIVGSHEIQLEK